MSPLAIPVRVSAVLLLVLHLSLSAGCASPDAIQRPCCYQGELTLAHLERVRFVMDDGTELQFDQVYKGFESQNRSITTPFPFLRVAITALVYDVLSVVFPTYDANNNGILEEPELTVLYVREGALGMGFKVSHLVVEKRVVALQTSPGDVGGLVTYINSHRSGMSQEAQKLFREIDHLATQIRRRGVGSVDQSFLGP